MEEKKKSGLATAGMVLGIVAICISFIPIINNFAFILGALALIFGLITVFKNDIGKGKPITAIVLSILSILITIQMQKAVVEGLEDIGNELNDSMGDLTGENTDKVLENDVDVKLGEFEVVKEEYLDNTKMTVEVKNKSDKKASYSITVEAADKEGNRIDMDYIYANDLASGQSQKFDIFTFLSSDKHEAFKNATFKIVSVSKY